MSARTDYAVRALLLLADRAPALVTADALTAEQNLPRGFVEGILNELRKLELVISRRGFRGGYTLARPADAIPVGEVLRLLDGPLITVGSHGASTSAYGGVAVHVPELWRAMDASLGRVLDSVTIADLLAGGVPNGDT